MSVRGQLKGTPWPGGRSKDKFKTYLLHQNYISSLATRGQGDPPLTKAEHKHLLGASRAYYFPTQPANKFVEMKFDIKKRAEHTERVFKATKKIDNDAPRLFPRMPRTERAAFRLDDLMLENKQILERICTIWRTKGIVDTSSPLVFRKSNYRQRMWDMVRVEAENVALLYFIQKAEPHVPTRKECARDFKTAVEKMRFICRYPLQFVKDPTADHPLPMADPPPVDPLAPPRKRVFMEFITSKERLLGRIEIELFEEQAPQTAANFLAYIRGEAPAASQDGKPVGKAKKGPLSYRETPLHRILPGYYCMGGDVINHNGSGVASIHGGAFPDEKNDLQHSEAGLLCTIGAQPDSNDSKFMITMKPLPSLDSKSTVFGRVIKGFEVLWAINSLGARASGKPIEQVYCCNCGEVERPPRTKKEKKKTKKKKPVKAELRDIPEEEKKSKGRSRGRALRSANSSGVSSARTLKSSSQFSRLA